MSKRKKIWLIIALVILAFVSFYQLGKFYLNATCIKYDSGGWGGNCLKGAPAYCKSVYVKGSRHEQSSTRCRFFKIRILPRFY
jgi:hypothetical protein